MLEVSKNVKPNSVQWQNLNETLLERTDQMIFANIITFGSIVIVAVIVSYAKNIHPLAASFAIAGKKVGEESTF